ncbi:MAG: class I SAM-dependent methyltransferase [Chloroflexota bacterium]
MTTNLDRYAGQARRVAAYERWLRSSTPGAVALRWLLGPGQWASNTAIYRLAASLKLDHTTTLLDIGCERGSVLRTLDDQLHLDVPPVGVDLSHAMLELAQRDERNPRRGAGLVQGSAMSLPLRDATFSLVTCGYVLHDLDDDEARALLYEVGRVLAPGGIAVIWDFGPTGNARLDAWNARVVATGGVTPRLRSASTLRRLATEVGFPFTRDADLRPFLLPPVPRASIMIGRPPEDFDLSRLG